MAYNKILFIFHVVCMFCFSSCSSYPEEVEKALSVLGNNRAELVRVLEHYRSNDRLKFKAACFLISNMPYHKSGYNIELPKSYFTYFKMVDSMGTLIPDANHNDSLTKVLGQQYASLAFPHDKVNTLDDIQRFTAEFLIENIDDAFMNGSILRCSKAYLLMILKSGFCHIALSMRILSEINRC